MKSGTSSLRALLDAHPGTYLPGTEVFFFSIDDFDEHPNHFFQTHEGWTLPDYERNFEFYRDWYASLFEDAPPDAVIGEGSSTYLTSRHAPGRMHEVLPEVKLVVMLRDPVSRTYSHYWHLVRNGTALFDFETTLERAPETIIKRSRYEQALRRYLEYFDRHQLKIVFFQDFVEDPQTVIDEVCSFLGLPPVIDAEADRAHQNSGGAPASIQAKLLENRVFRRHTDLTSLRGLLDHLPDIGAPQWSDLQQSRGLRGVFTTLLRNRGVAWLQRNLFPRDYPQMQQDTRLFLEGLLERENRGLSELIQVDVSDYWPYFG